MKINKKVISTLALGAFLIPMLLVRAQTSVKSEEVPYYAGKPGEVLYAEDVESGHTPIYHNNALVYLAHNDGTNKSDMYVRDIQDSEAPAELLGSDVQSMKFVSDSVNSFYGVIYSRYTDSTTGYDIYLYSFTTGNSNPLCVLAEDQLNPANSDYPMFCDVVVSQPNGEAFDLVKIEYVTDHYNTSVIDAGNTVVYEANYNSNGQDIEYIRDEKLYAIDKTTGDPVEKATQVQSFVSVGYMGYYESNATGNGDIYYYNFNLDEIRQITTTGNREFLPSYQYNSSIPDALTYLQTLNADGTLGGGVRVVTPNLAWGPNNTPTIVSTLVSSSVNDSTNDHVTFAQGYSFWTRVVGGQTNIYGFNTGSLDRVNAKTVGDFVVWEDKRNGEYYEIYAYNKKTEQQTKISGAAVGYAQPMGYATDKSKYILYTELVENPDQDNYDDRCITLYNLETGQRTVVAKDDKFIGLSVGANRVIYEKINLDNSEEVSVYRISDGQVTPFPYTTENFISVTSTDGRYVAFREDNVTAGTGDFLLYDLDQSRLITMKAGVARYGRMGGNQHRPEISGDSVYWYDDTKIYIYTISTGAIREVALALKEGYMPMNIVLEGDTLIWDEYKIPEEMGYNGGFMNQIADFFSPTAALAASNSMINIFSLSGNALLGTIVLNTTVPQPGNLYLSKGMLAYGDVSAEGYNSIYLANVASLASASTPLSSLPKTGITALFYLLVMAGSGYVVMNRRRIFRKKKVWES